MSTQKFVTQDDYGLFTEVDRYINNKLGDKDV